MPVRLVLAVWVVVAACCAIRPPRDLEPAATAVLDPRLVRGRVTAPADELSVLRTGATNQRSDLLSPAREPVSERARGAAPTARGLGPDRAQVVGQRRIGPGIHSGSTETLWRRRSRSRVKAFASPTRKDPTMSTAPATASHPTPSAPGTATLPGPASGRLATSRAAATPETAEDGMTTAEYAVGTLAACALAAVLLFVVKDSAVQNAILGVITTALQTR